MNSLVEQPVSPQPLTAAFRSWPLSDRIAWSCVAVVVSVFVYALASYWIPFDGLDRLVILAGVVWAWNYQRSRFSRSPSFSSTLAGVALLIVGFALAVPSWFALSQIGARPVLTWMLAATSIASLIGLVWIQFGWRSGFLLIVPLAISILALPIPGRINVPLQTVLQSFTTYTAHQLLAVTGHDVVREGFVLRLPHGDLGIVEACSGVKALTTFLAVACLTAHYYRFGPIRMVLAILLALPVVILANGLRVFTLGIIQENFGQEATQGWRHEVFGSIPVLLGLGLVFFITRCVAMGRKTPDVNQPVSHASNSTASRGMVLAAIIAVIGLVLGGIAISRPSVARVAVPDGNAPIDQIPMTLGEWHAQDVPIDPLITSELNYNKAICRNYSTALGYEMSVWVIYWSTAKSVKGYHHPDICMTARGSELLFKDEIAITSREHRSLPVTYREFGRDANKPSDRQIVIYWTQEGQLFWTPDDEKAAFNMSFPFRWIAQRMGERPANSVDDRIVVLIGMKSWGKTGQRQMIEQFAGDLADELYRVCPWADPKTAH